MVKKATKKKGPPTRMGSDPIIAFKNQKEWESWLRKNHRTSTGIWMRLAKKASGIPSITYPDAVESALCYGWIDGLKRPESETAWLQRFTARRPRSMWSEINRQRALALIGAERMQAAGLEEVERARKDGRWEAAYGSQAAVTIDREFEKALNKRRRAVEFFKTISAANRYAILWRIQTAKKPETRERRIREYVEMLEKGETLH
ncbi:MAG: YdeI/OmpD-associated family protein [Gemmatimonadaceae bacterium]